MIKSKKELREFIEADRKANGFKKGYNSLFNVICRYLIRLRKTEFLYNRPPKGLSFLFSKI